MTEVLQKFSTGSVSVLLWVMLGSWLLWPVLCGVLGARRNLAMEGAMHGLFWGPIGLLVVLMKKPKHRCPTCGQRSLTVPAEQRPGAAWPPNAITFDEASPASSPAGRLRPQIVEERRQTPTAPGGLDTSADAVGEGFTQKELDALHAWVNGG